MDYLNKENPVGLDAYVETRIENNEGELIKGCEVWYGRKEWHIQHWMADEYQNLFPDDESGFNLQPLTLTQELMDKLRADFVAGTLLGAEGCFKDIDEGQQEAVLKLLTRTEYYLSMGEHVVYTAWY